MQVILTGHHIDITDSLRNYVTSKVEKLERHFDNAINIHVVLTVEKLRHKAEATLHLSGQNIFADHTEEDMYAAIDGLIDKLDRQVKKYKEKLKDHHRSEAVKSNQLAE